MTVPNANQTRIGPLGFVIRCLNEPELMFTHRTTFLDGVRELTENQQARRNAKGDTR
jgi:hypothetical protein